jgi:glycosyltransferase involved in cell wall biosynthesis
MDYISEVSDQGKEALFASCDVLLMSSVKEGWGLTVTEAAQQGTPSIVYDVDGLKDSVQQRVTGLICETNSPTGMSKAILEFFGDDTDREILATNALEESRIHTVDNTYLSFQKALQYFGYIDNV